MSLQLYTIETIDQSLFKPLGAVFANCTTSIKLGGSRGFLGSSGNNADRPTLVKNKLNELTADLIKELRAQTSKIYNTALALVNVRINTSNISNDNTIILVGSASATAITKRSKPLNTKMSSQGPVASAPLASQGPVASAPLASQGPIASQGPVASQGPMASQGPVASPPLISQGPVALQAPMNIPMPVTTGGKRSKAKSRKQRNKV